MKLLNTILKLKRSCSALFMITNKILSRPQKKEIIKNPLNLVCKEKKLYVKVKVNKIPKTYLLFLKIETLKLSFTVKLQRNSLTQI